MKKNIKYIVLVVADIVGAITVFFFIHTHFLLVTVISIDLYSFTKKSIEKTGKIVSGGSKLMLITGFTIFWFLVLGLSFYFYKGIMMPNGI